MIKVFNKITREWLDDVYIDKYENVYRYKRNTLFGNGIILEPIDDDCFVLQNVGYVDKNGHSLYDNDIITDGKDIKQGVIICFNCTYIVIDYAEEKYYPLNSLNPLDIQYVGNVIDTKVYDKNGNVVEFVFQEDGDITDDVNNINNTYKINFVDENKM